MMNTKTAGRARRSGDRPSLIDCVFAIGLTWGAVSCVFGQRTESEIAEGLIRRMDANQDGKLEPSEIPASSRNAVRQLAEQAGLENGEAWSVDLLLKQLKRERKSKDEPASPVESRRSTAAAPFQFGGKAASDAQVRGFGDGTTSGKPLEEQYDQRVIQYVDRFLRRNDRNENGQLDADEWRAVRWGKDPKESDTNGDGVLTRAELCARMSKRWGSSNDAESKREGSSSGGAARGSDGNQAKQERYAKSLLKQFDSSGNGVLEKEEWSQMKTRYAAADANKDSVITVQELTVFNSGYSRKSSLVAKREDKKSPTSSERRRDRGRDSDRRRDDRRRGDEAKEKKSYRFLTATERLSETLSDRQQESFVKLDRNGDGQIAMAEFSTVWNDAKVREFSRFDQNRDGLVTPVEYSSSKD